MKIKNYIWDFDGTLLDTYDFLTDSLKKALEKNGIFEDKKEISEILHVSYFKASTYYANKHGVAIENIDKWYKEFSHQIDYSKIRTFDYIEDTLKGIVNSGGQNFIFTHRGKSIYEMLERFNLLEYFVEIVDSTAPFPRKPKPDANIYLIEKYNLEKSKTMYIGDRDIDILSGKDAGIKTCYYKKNETCEIADYNITTYEKFLNIFVNDWFF